MDLLTKADLEQLAERDRPDVAVSMFIPTHPSGEGTRTDPIRWKNLLSTVEDALRERGMRTPDIAELLAPAQELLDDHVAWRYMSDGLAMFLRPGWHRTFRVPALVPEVATVGDRFIISPLLPLATGDSHFLLLALSQRKVRLLEGTLQRVEEIEIADVPTSLRDVIEPADGRSDAIAFSLSPGPGRSGTAIFYGHGAGDDDDKRDDLRRFFRQVADGLGDYLNGQQLPMVLVGLDDNLSLYRDVNAYPNVLDDAVVQNPDELSAEQLHATAWPLIEKRLGEERAEAVGRFGELHGTGRASTDLDKIEEAARYGRVDTLFIATDPAVWTQGNKGAVVELGADADFAHWELLDHAAVDTLTNSGRVYTMPGDEVPGVGDLAAIFRY